MPNVEALIDSGTTAAHTISNGIVDFLSAIEGNDPSYSHYPATRNFDLLEILADDFTDTDADVELLVTRELATQKDTLNQLAAKFVQDYIKMMRSKSYSLFGDLWFTQ